MKSTFWLLSVDIMFNWVTETISFNYTLGSFKNNGKGEGHAQKFYYLKTRTYKSIFA